MKLRDARAEIIGNAEYFEAFMEAESIEDFADRVSEVSLVAEDRLIECHMWQGNQLYPPCKHCPKVGPPSHLYPCNAKHVVEAYHSHSTLPCIPGLGYEPVVE